MRTIAFFNQKGGVGKTTSAINVAAGIAHSNKRVLLIDFDPQASLTHSCGIDPHELAVTINNFLKKEVLFEDVAIKKNNMTILPSSIALSGLEHECAGMINKDHILRVALKPLYKQFDYIFIDCPPSLGFLTLNVLAAVQEIFIPVQTEFLALQGLSQMLDTISVVQQKINPNVKVTGIIGTRYNRRKIHNDVVEFLQVHFRDKTFNTLIRENIALAEAPSFGKHIFDHNLSCHGAHDYRALCKEILKQEKSR